MEPVRRTAGSVFEGIGRKHVAIMDGTMNEQLRHLTNNERAALEVFATKLREQFDDRVVRIVLFGSKARGDSDSESDIDVLVVVDNGDWRFRDALALVAFEPMIEYDVVLSPLIVDTDDYAWWQEHHAPIYRHISAEGVELWTKQRPPSFASA
jgi:predicted nucleotidyltransferase